MRWLLALIVGLNLLNFGIAVAAMQSHATGHACRAEKSLAD